GIISRATDPFGRSSGYRTVSGGRASGVEATVRVTAPRMNVTGAYTWTSTSSSDGPSAPSLSYGLPAHQGSIEAVVRATERLQFAALLAVASSYLAPIPDAVTFVSRTYRFDGMHQADLSAQYRFA